MSESSTQTLPIAVPFELGVTHLKLVFADGEVTIPRKIAAMMPPIANVREPVLWFDYKTKEPFLEVFRAITNAGSCGAGSCGVGSSRHSPQFSAEMVYWGFIPPEKFCIKCESYLAILRTLASEARNGTCVSDLCCTNNCAKNVFSKYSNYCQSHVCDDTGAQSHASCVLIYQHTGPHFDGWEIWH